MVKFYFNKRILIGYLVALAILSWLAVSSYFRTKQLVQSNELVVHTLDVLYNTERALAITTNIELGQRGFALTGNEVFLATHQRATQQIGPQIDSLQMLTQDNIDQRARVVALKQYVNGLIAFSQYAVEKRKENFELARTENSTLRGKQLLDSVRSVISQIEEAENRLLQARNRENEKQITKFNLTFISLIITTAIILIVIFYAINVNLKARQRSEEKLRTLMDEITDLYDNAPCGYHSIDDRGFFVNINNTLCDWLGYEKNEIVNRMKFTDIITESDKAIFAEKFERFKTEGEIYDLEFCFRRKNGTEFPVILSAIAIKDADGKYVKSRSITINNTERKLAETKIRNLNHELEAFTYSVSHDLRAPLRSIDGYSRILQEDYSDKLDPEGKRVLQVVMNSARRMGKLIDDLLDFARLGRKEVARANVNMNLIVNNLAKELAEQEKGRQIEFKIHSLHNAPVDVDMIRQVWENLLSNAIKYSGKQEKSIIEVNSLQRQHEVVYSVKDNGVGFDMQYVGKLFGVFQRLHKLQDFSGTGVGLAIVKRVVDRHQGRVWAEAKLNEGATFYFTIPNENGKQ